MKRVLVDANFWIALFDPKKDALNRPAIEWLEKAQKAKFKILLAWPIFYEILGTRTARDFHKVTLLHRHLQSLAQQLEYVDDTPYRNKCLEESKRDQRDLSLVDRVMRHMLLDVNKGIQGMLTSNEKDFVDVCRHRKITLERLKSIKT